MTNDSATVSSSLTPSVISIVDDDASVRVALNNLLQSRGHVVHTFEAAEEFLASSHLSDTSCVIADVQMAAMSGLDPAALNQVANAICPTRASGRNEETCNVKLRRPR
jgi:FixJ family two-component response regulator